MKAILFDVDDTLYDQLEPFRNAYNALFGTRFNLDIAELFAARGRRGDESFALSQSGKMPMEEMYIYRVQKAFEDLGVEVSAKESLQFQKLYEENQNKIYMSGTVTSMLDACFGRGLRMGIVTNGGSAHQWNKIRLLGLDKWFPEKCIFVSGDCGVAKPEPEFFRFVEKRMGLSGKEICIVGDSYQNDVAGAKRAGWQAVWLNKRNLDISEEELQPDYIVDSEEGMRSLIGQLLG